MFAAIVGQSWADDAHPYNIECNGIDVVAKVPMQSVKIEMAGPGTNGSMSFTVFDANASVTVAEWDEVRFIEHAATRPILFGGFVQSVRYRAWAVTGRMIEVECVGYGILLDRKVVPTTVVPSWGVAEIVVPLINLYGGRLRATARDYASATGLETIDGTYSVVEMQADWNTWGHETTLTAVTLRSALQSIIDVSVFLTLEGAAAATFWVDNVGRVCLVPDFPAGTSFSVHDDQRFADTVPGFQLNTSGTYRIEGLTYEREDTDRVTSAYVVGGQAAGTGYYRTPALERVGDLETIVTDPDSVVAADIQTVGAVAVGRTTFATVRGEVTLFATAPLDLWPGRHIDLAVAAVDLTAAEDFRVTAVRVQFRSSTARTYGVGFGGSIPTPSLANRQGRYATR